MRVFIREGYTHANMDVIATEAGVTKQTVYAHFKNKENLFAEIVSLVATAGDDVIKAIPVQAKSLEEKLYSLGLNFIDIVTSAEGLGLTRLAIAESIRQPKLANLYYKSGSQLMLKTLSDELERQNQLGHLDVEDTVSAASYFYTMLKGNYYLKVLLNAEPMPTVSEKKRHIQECVNIFLKLYAGKNPISTRSRLS